MATSTPTNTVVDDSMNTATMSASAIQQKYQKEREKRLRADGLAQYIDLTKSEKFKHFQEDPWVNHEALNAQELPLKDGQAYKFLILGAGYGGLLFAVRLIQAGFKSDDIRLVDSAGGFGGTWYYNRYPGLQCDVESYMYMPLLEETGHMPTYKYAQGSELREYAETIAKKWDLETKTAFRLEIDSMTWQDQDKQWCVNIKQNRGPGQEILQMQVQAQFVITASGLLNYPQIPDIPGIANFRGHIFHTSRWDYKYTGGSQREPVMDVLKDKRVGVIGTGATAIQVVPQLAKYAKELFVFQRTPSAVDRRDNRKTDPQWWARETKDKNWQRRRTENFNSFLCNVSPPPAVNMVDDAWTHMPSYSALIGADKGIIAPDKVPAHLVELHAMDLVRQERVRARVEETVNDKATAEKLKSWYPGWCKRPTFHDEYLPTFNRPNVTLVDTNGKGADKTTQDGIIVAGKEYKVDLLVMSTGYRSPGKDVSPASRANMTVIGRDGKSLEEEWSKHGISTLHGCISRGFPNLFFPGPMQAAASVNFTSTLDQMATHVAYMASAGRKKAGQEKFTIEPTAKAQDEWSMMILTRAAAFAGVQGCTPSYFNREGETDRVRNSEEQMMAAKGAPWGEGMNSFVRVIEGWRAQGSMDGIEITAFEGDN